MSKAPVDAKLKIKPKMKKARSGCLRALMEKMRARY